MIIDDTDERVLRVMHLQDPGWSMWTGADGEPSHVAARFVRDGLAERSEHIPGAFRLTDLGRSYAADVLRLEALR